MSSGTGDKWQVTRTNRPCQPVTFHVSVSRFYWLALAFFALGLMAKPMLVTLPFVMLLLDYWPLERLQSSRFEVQPSGFVSGKMAVLSARADLVHRHFSGATPRRSGHDHPAISAAFASGQRLDCLRTVSRKNILAVGPGHPLPAAQSFVVDPGHGGDRHRVCWAASPGSSGGRAGHVPICWSAGSGFWERSCRSLGWCRWAARRWRIVTLIFRSSACSLPWRSASAIWRTGFSFRKPPLPPPPL